jgi:hypothetical protein
MVSSIGMRRDGSFEMDMQLHLGCIFDKGLNRHGKKDLLICSIETCPQLYRKFKEFICHFKSGGGISGIFQVNAG